MRIENVCSHFRLPLTLLPILANNQNRDIEIKLFRECNNFIFYETAIKKIIIILQSN